MEGPPLPLWCFGEEGAARLVVTVRYDTAFVYDADNDKDHSMSVDSLIWWLDKHEREHTGLTDAQVDLRSELIPLQAEQWLEESGEDDEN